MLAVVALMLMPAKRRSSAVLNGTHNTTLATGQLMRFSILRAILTEDIRHLSAARCAHSDSECYELWLSLSSGLVTCERFS